MLNEDDNSTQRFRILWHTIHFIALCLTALYVGVAALHDQPFRALHGLAVAGAVDIVSLVWIEYDHNTACKRKPF